MTACHRSRGLAQARRAAWMSRAEREGHVYSVKIPNDYCIFHDNPMRPSYLFASWQIRHLNYTCQVYLTLLRHK